MFYDLYNELCQEKGVSCSRAAKEIGLSNSTVTKWKNTGATPSGDTLSKVAAYFGVSVNYLIGEQKNPLRRAMGLQMMILNLRSLVAGQYRMPSMKRLNNLSGS